MEARDGVGGKMKRSDGQRTGRLEVQVRERRGRSERRGERWRSDTWEKEGSEVR